MGRFLAGLPGNPGSPFQKWEADPAWKRHRDEFNRAWARMEAGSLPGMLAFQKSELSREPIEGSVVFYPFSGPDALTLTLLFPHNRLYLMVGLEPAGTLPTAGRLAGQPLELELAKTRETLASVLRRSFFITRQMDRQFRGQVTDGLLPAILQLLVRTHHTVLGFRYVRLDEQGGVVQREANYQAPGKIGNKGVEIDFESDSDHRLHKLFYFSINLADNRLGNNRPFLRFLSGFRGMTTFFKSTSYMPHHREFSLIREQVLNLSGAVLQDDSGIPFQYFDPKQWRIELYGAYDRPYGSFKWFQQPALKKAYAALRPKPMGFRIGYGFSRAPSNLMLARRAGKPRG